MIVTHDAAIGAACNRVVRMQDGLIVDDGLVPQPVRADPSNAEPVIDASPYQRPAGQEAAV